MHSEVLPRHMIQLIMHLICMILHFWREKENANHLGVSFIYYCGVEACKHSCILHSYRRAGFQLDHGLMSTSDNKHVYTNAPSPDGHP